MARKPVKPAVTDATPDLLPPLEAIAAPVETTATTTKGKKRKQGSRVNSASATPAKVVTEIEATAINSIASVSKEKNFQAVKSNGSSTRVEEDTTTTPRGSRKPTETAPSPATKKSRTEKVVVKQTTASVTPADGPADERITHPIKKKRKSKAEPEAVKEATTTSIPADTPASPTTEPVKKKRKTKAELQAAKEAAMIPLLPRTANHAYKIGAHVSASGGIHNAVVAANQIGGNAFALFMKSQRKWTNPPLLPDVAQQFVLNCEKLSYEQTKYVVPHGSYLVNLAHTDRDRTQQAYESFLDDLKRCEEVGIGLYNFHPGNVQGVSRGEALTHLAKNLNRAHKATRGVVTLLENMAAAGGNVIGCRFEELGEVIEQVDDKSRVGVCLDTCHAFAAGYDVKDKEGLTKVLDELDAKVGLKYLRALHMNDSKAPLGSGRDLHANIGTGFIGLKGFHAIMNEERLRGLPMVLETPTEMLDDEGNAIKDKDGLMSGEQKSVWAQEIKLLESLTGMDIESEEFKTLETKLAGKGRKERARIQDQVDRRGEKKTKSKGGKKKGKKDAETSDEESDA
ncbi:xylose isomerase-like protein [Elsinoe ampelina]|uniref:Apurinic-apyrimidinic endonuclease 1 n=1 Tax=Elsinoe ampelina TaxID=302913 RepID=A0A6A6GQT6_9PEZI|nr:xylose isomerase-like protein [Elsinoe ampelina]